MGFFLKSLGLASLSTDPDAPLDSGATVRPPLRSDRPAVTLDTALTLPAVLRAIQLLSGMAAQLTIEAYRGSEVVPSSLVAQPDPWRDQASWIERACVNLAGDGNAFIRKTYQDGVVVALTVLDPFRVHAWRDRKGRKWFDYTDEVGKRHRYNAADVIHLWALEVPGHERALGPIGWCRANLEGYLDTRDYASDVFRNGSVSNGTLTSEQPLDVPAMKEYQKVWRDHDPRNVRVLGRGLKYAPVAINPKDAQWLESQQLSVVDVARMFGIPAPLLEAAIEGESLTYQTLLDVNTKFLTTTLFPIYLRKIESALTSVLPRGQRARFDASNLLRPDVTKRMENHKTAIDAGIYDAAYARSVEGIPDTAAPTRKEAPAA